MADAVPIESVESSRLVTLEAFEGRNYYNLPEEVEIGDRTLIDGFEDLRLKTQDTKLEWRGYITKDALGDLNLRFITAGDDEAHAQAVEIRDLTGLNNIFPAPSDYALALDAVIQGQGWRSNPLVVFGKDLDPIDSSKVGKGVKVVPNEEFLALVHTHLGNDSFSPDDGFMIAEQQFRPDGRPQISISIEIGPDEINVIVVPTDGVVKNKSPFDAPTGMAESIKLVNRLAGLSQSEQDQMIDDYIQTFCKERRFGLYRGSLKDGVLKRRELGIGKKLKDLGFNEVQIRRLEFNPNIPDPDLQVAAILSVNKAFPRNAAPEEASLIAQDFINFTEAKFMHGRKLRLEQISKDRFWVVPQTGQQLELVEVRITDRGLEIVFPRKSFYGDKESEQMQASMIMQLEDYYRDRLADRLPLQIM